MPAVAPSPRSSSPDPVLEAGARGRSPRLSHWPGVRILLAVLLGLLLVLNYMLWLSADQGLRKVRSLELAVQAQKAENALLAERNSALEAEVRDLKEGLSAIEERARAELGMIREDETFYRVLEDPPASVAPPAAAGKAPIIGP